MATSRKKSALLKPAVIEKKHKKLIDWTLNSKGSEISRTFLFPTFIGAFAFTAKIVVHAEILNHHPDIFLSYGKLKVTLTTHDVKGLTNADFELAERIDNLKSN